MSVNCCSGSCLDPYMAKTNRKNIDEVLIKFRAPAKLKRSVQDLANERNIALSAFLRLITTEYVKRHEQT